MASNLVGLVFCLLLVALWFGVRREDRLARELSCRHKWVVESLYNEGRMWYRRCVRCGKQEPVGHPHPAPHRASARTRHPEHDDQHR